MHVHIGLCMCACQFNVYNIMYMFVSILIFIYRSNWCHPMAELVTPLLSPLSVLEVLHLPRVS